MDRFFIDCDESGDFYLVPLDQLDAWELYRDGESDELPSGCKFLDWPNRVTFENPEVLP